MYDIRSFEFLFVVCKMAEFKQVFDIVKSEILENGLSFDEFTAWLSKKKINGEYLENWNAIDMRDKVKEYKANNPRQMMEIKNSEKGIDHSLDSDEDQDMPSQRMPVVSPGITFNDTQPHYISILK